MGGAQLVAHVVEQAALRVEGALQAIQHAVERVGEVGYLVAAARVDAGGQVVFADARGRAAQRPERPQDAARDEPAHEPDDHERAGRDEPIGAERLGDLGESGVEIVGRDVEPLGGIAVDPHRDDGVAQRPEVGCRGAAHHVVRIRLLHDAGDEVGVVVEPEADAAGGAQARTVVDHAEGGLVVIRQHARHRLPEEVQNRGGLIAAVASVGDALQTLDGRGEAIVDLCQHPLALDEVGAHTRGRHADRGHQQHRREDAHPRRAQSFPPPRRHPTIIVGWRLGTP